MARTKTPTPEQAPAVLQAPPDPPTQDVARPSPVLAWPTEWPVPELPTEKQKRTRGLPMGPVLAGASNATTLTATAAYSAGGPVAAAATGVVIVAGATAAVLRRRATVKASRATASRLRSGGGSAPRSGSWTSGGRSGSGSGRGVSGGRSGGATRSGSGTRGPLSRSGSGSSGLGSRGASRGVAGGGTQRSRGGLLGKGSTGRHNGPGRHRLGSDKPGATKRQQKKTEAAAQKAAQKAARKALKQAAKDLAAKNTGKTNAAKTGTPGTGHALKAAAGRAARAAYHAGRPLLTRARKAAARQARKAGGALWDGLCAAAAAGLTLLGRGRHAALDRLKAVWRRRRKTREDAQQNTPDTPTVAATVRRPTNPTPVTTTGGTGMSGGHHFVAAATEMARAAAAYQPTGMLQVGQDFAGLEEALRIHAEAVKTTVENADANWPLHPNIVEIMRQIHSLQLKAAELATELKPAFQQLHDVDIARLENPRNGERMWDLSNNL